MPMFHKASYESHARSYADDRVDPDRIKVADSWLDFTTADAWRHERMYEIADYLGEVPSDSWLTVGDGRFGLDAIRLMAHGVANVTATDIDASLLQEAAEQGRIKDYSAQNAEQMSFADGSFDYAFCKESYHHFPRPALALYEMLRVARKGVVLIEPNDRLDSPKRIVGKFVRRLLGKPLQHMDAQEYEPSGNYIFTISPREMEKVALGIDLPQIAYKGFNDYYIAGLEFTPGNEASPLFRKMRRHIALNDFLCRLGLEKWAYLTACLFHEPVSAGVRERMVRNGWTFVDLPRNPYLNGA
jgi:ubiquinone/menaquinone biosynthesis C-methylase UbiE